MSKKTTENSTEKTAKKYANAEEIADRLGMSKTWIWQKARRGEIPCFKIGKYYFFTPEDVDVWVRKHAQTTQ